MPKKMKAGAGSDTVSKPYNILRFYPRTGKWLLVYGGNTNRGTKDPNKRKSRVKYLLEFSTENSALQAINKLRVSDKKKRKYLIVRAWVTCPNCLRPRAEKVMDFIDLCYSCLRVLRQEMDAKYPLVGMGGT